MGTWLKPTLLLACGLTLTSCAAPAHREDPSLMYLTMRPALRALWEGAGGLPAWKKFKSVRFTHQAELGSAGRALLNGRRGSSLSSPDTVGPELLGFEIGDWDTMEVGRVGSRSSLHLLDSSQSQDFEDYARRAIRVFICFPFNLADPVWEFRHNLIAGEQPDPGAFLLFPVGEFSPHSGYRVELDPELDSPRAVYYEVDHPLFHGQTFLAVFSRFETVKGVRMATEITHYRHNRAPPQAGHYPWNPPGTPGPDVEGRPVPASFRESRDFVYRERIWNIELTEKPVPNPASPGPGEKP